MFLFQTVGISLTIFSSRLTSFLCTVFDLHQTAGPILTCSNHTITDSHVHGGTCVSIMRVKETGTVLMFSNQLKIQKVLKHTVMSFLLLQLIYIIIRHHHFHLYTQTKHVLVLSSTGNYISILHKNEAARYTKLIIYYNTERERSVTLKKLFH